MYDLLNKARKNGIISLEDDIEKPTESPILSTNTLLMKDHHLRDFLCDTMRSAVTGTDPFELDQVVETDLEVHHHTSTQPITALSTMADSLPGLGIVAAVLGVVIVQYIVKNEDEDKSEAIPAPKQE
jgi:chemotaxis protein MotA